MGFSLFLPFFEKTFLQLFLHVYLQGMAQNTFLVCKLIFHTLLPVLQLQSENFLRMSMSKDEMVKHYDYQMKEKVVQEEEASCRRLCSKLVSNNITLNTPFIGHFMFLRLFWMLDQKS